MTISIPPSSPPCKTPTRTKSAQFFDSVQKNFQGDYVIDMAKLRDSAKTILPILESYQETAPYAAWLKTRMDYLDAAEELRLRIPPPKGNAPLPPAIPYNPPPEVIREIWVRKFSERPVPEEAKPYVSKIKTDFLAAKSSETNSSGWPKWNPRLIPKRAARWARRVCFSSCPPPPSNTA